MTIDPFRDAVAIDTNVFKHVLNPQKNSCFHINRLLNYLQMNNVTLIVDSGGKILGEYKKEIIPIIQNADDVRDEIYILRYWMQIVNPVDIPVNANDNLMTRIMRVIHERSESVDRTFVYVAFKRGNLLISNDRNHIVVGHQGETRQGERRQRLRRETRRQRELGAGILTSEEAHAEIPS